jgi:hypothetical protein
MKTLLGTPDPDQPEQPPVRFLRAYTTADPPQPGDLVVTYQNTNLVILGSHTIPSGTVEF